MIAHAAPPAPVIAAPAVSFGSDRGAARRRHPADRGPGRRPHHAPPVRPAGPAPHVGPRAGGRPRRAGAAIGRGGSRWSATVRVRALPRRRPARGPDPGLRRPRPQRRRRPPGRRRCPAITGVYVQHLVTGCGASSNADAQFPAASTLKAAILVDAVRRGRADDLRSTLDRMIIDSDDVAANSVLAALGGGSGDAGAAQVTDTLHALGLAGPWCAARTSSRTPASRCLIAHRPLPRAVHQLHQHALRAGAPDGGRPPRRGRARRRRAARHRRREARAELLARLLDVRDTSKLVAGLPASASPSPTRPATRTMSARRRDHLPAQRPRRGVRHDLDRVRGERATGDRFIARGGHGRAQHRLAAGGSATGSR